VSFFVLLAIFPAITALVSAYGLFFSPSTIINNLSLLNEVMPDNVLNIVHEQASRIASNNGGALSIGIVVGILVSLWSAMSGVKAMIDTLNEQVGLYLFPLAIGNFCGPLLLGSLFDTVGRKKMIAGTFAMSGVLLLVTAYMFGAGLLSATTQTIAGASYSFLHQLPPVPPTSQLARYFPSKRERWPLPASTRSAPPSAAALLPFYSGG